ncbi:uncharacterized protein KIAA1143 homolog [Melitaea cinxia]|uniref:uncharacterized protein KIAA1143 homolog n=1 Tax=Melitaea cinxia TaxID=113334 RepID=UPI001E273E47|nr:uncharacterized protein KIAA1143 homolog [Melitaea cinxia]
MNRKRNISYIKPEDPHFLKVLKKQAGYDDVNHKFDKLENSEEDFVEDEESESPQVVVLNKGDLTAQEAEAEKERIKKIEAETKADLSQRVIFKKKSKTKENDKSKHYASSNKLPSKANNLKLLSFGDDNLEDEDE